MPKRTACRAAAALPMLSFATAAFAAADKRPGLDPDFPVRMEDAYPVQYQQGYFKLISRYSDAENGTDLTLVQPEIAYGFAPNLDVHLSSPIQIGDGNRTGSGDLNLNVQWLFLDEQPGEWWPAAAFEGTVLFPTGVASDGIDLGGQFNFTKTLVWAPTWDSLHLNLTYQHNFVPNADQRDESYNAIFGYSRRVLASTTFLADVFWEKTLTEHFSTQVAEIGLMQEIGDHVKIAGGVGVGLGDDSPDFTATIGVIISN